jgi:hypothetical protein
MTQVQSVRFDNARSPTWINSGGGWTPEHAKQWLQDHDLDDYESTEFDACYFRFKRYDAAEFIGTKDIEEGVTVIQCAKK